MKKHLYSFRLPRALMVAVQDLADARGCTRTAVVIDALWAYLGVVPEPPPR